MTKLEYFEVEFDEPDATYKPGEIVTGKVVFELSGPINVREIRLKARGKAYVEWREQKNYHRNWERIFEIIDKLAVSETDDEQITLPAGQHSYNFSFQLPDDIPCSFAHTYGHIEYTVKAILDRPWKFDHEVTSDFAVIAPYDSSIKEDYAEGILDDIEHNFTSYFCYDAGFMNIDVSSPTSGFYPGDTIKLTVNYNSEHTRMKITCWELQLEQTLTFHSTHGIKSHSPVLDTIYQDGPFRKKGKYVIKMDVPEVSPSNLQNCSIIDADYNLVLIIHVSGWHSKITRSYPVQIWDTEEA